MEYKELNNGVKIPVVGLGTWDLRGRECIASVQRAVDIGYRLIDTAIMYGNEREVGEGISTCGIGRSELFVTTKINRPHAGYQKTLDAVERCLSVMKLDYLDLVLIHEPYEQYIKMYKALEKAYRDGKVRAIGVSNLNAHLYDRLLEECEIVPMVSQVESHVYYPQLDYRDHMQKNGTVMQSWGPFTEGKRKIFSEPVLRQIAEMHHKTSARIALKYLVQNGICVIPKSSDPQHLRDNIDLFDFTLTQEDMKQIAELDGKRSLFGWYE